MEKRLYRSETQRSIAGVCGGLAEYFGLDVTIVRIIFVILGISAGPGVLLYIILWVIMPEESQVYGDVREAKRKNEEYDY